MAKSETPRAPVEHIIAPEKRLTAKWYKPDDCNAAIQGLKIPQALGDPVTQACEVRDIRAHPGFATELPGTLPIFTRALNARDIMSNIIPSMRAEEDFPYCIWYPNVATEDTCHKLAKDYPRMKYLVGRACAVAGYATLLDELDLLPEIHIVEEAYDNGQTEIYNTIMANRVKYEVLNDYKSSLARPCPHSKHPPSRYFNITEDYSFDTVGEAPPMPAEMKATTARLLYTPLPLDLPRCDKDLLLLAAAYHGNIERYIRLRRPSGWIIAGERSSIIRGIYHNTMFAKWWTTQLFDDYNISTAITARFIMNNDLSRINKHTPATRMPYCVWYPVVPRGWTLAALAQLRPDMMPQIARACIIGAYNELLARLNPTPEAGLYVEAADCKDTFFLQDLEAKLATSSQTAEFLIEKAQQHPDWEWKQITRSQAYERTGYHIYPLICKENIDASYPTMMDGSWTNMGTIELHISGVDTQDEKLLDNRDVTERAAWSRGAGDGGIEAGKQGESDVNELTQWLQGLWKQGPLEHGGIDTDIRYAEWVEERNPRLSRVEHA